VSRLTPQAGEVYQHYKGDHYMVLTFARHTEAATLPCDPWFVVYRRAIRLPNGVWEFDNTQPAVWARPLEMFLSEVAVENPDPATGVSAGVTAVERFRKIS
jgi:hypothetical protein